MNVCSVCGLRNGLRGTLVAERRLVSLRHTGTAQRARSVSRKDHHAIRQSRQILDAPIQLLRQLQLFRLAQQIRTAHRTDEEEVSAEQGQWVLAALAVRTAGN